MKSAIAKTRSSIWKYSSFHVKCLIQRVLIWKKTILKKENEKRFTYPIVKMNGFMLEGANEDYLKRYSLNILRQRSIEWMISIQVN